MFNKNDKHLLMLEDLTNQELGILVDILINDKDGESRFTEELTTDYRYEEFYPDHQKYWDAIAAEYQTFGSNTFATLFRRGKGTTYKNILINICESIEIDIPNEKYIGENNIVESLEQSLLSKVLAMESENIHQEDVENFLKTLEANDSKKIKEFMEPVLEIIKDIKSPDPITLTINIMKTMYHISQPAYRVILPATIYIAALRQMRKCYGSDCSKITKDEEDNLHNMIGKTTPYNKIGETFFLFDKDAESIFEDISKNTYVEKVINGDVSMEYCSNICIVTNTESLQNFELLAKNDNFSMDTLLILSTEELLKSSLYPWLYGARGMIRTLVPYFSKKELKTLDPLSMLPQTIIGISTIINLGIDKKFTKDVDAFFYMASGFSQDENSTCYYKNLGELDDNNTKVKIKSIPQSEYYLILIEDTSMDNIEITWKRIQKMISGRTGDVIYTMEISTKRNVSVFYR